MVALEPPLSDYSVPLVTVCIGICSYVESLKVPLSVQKSVLFRSCHDCTTAPLSEGWGMMRGGALARERPVCRALSSPAVAEERVMGLLLDTGVAAWADRDVVEEVRC